MDNIFFLLLWIGGISLLFFAAIIIVEHIIPAIKKCLTFDDITFNL